LTPTSTYAEFVPYGSRRQITVSVSEASVLPESTLLAGTLTVDIGRADVDPPEVLTGRLEGTFRAPGIGERIAEQNLSLLALDDLLGLPRATEP
jgi:hypothetical protein